MSYKCPAPLFNKHSAIICFSRCLHRRDEIRSHNKMSRCVVRSKKGTSQKDANILKKTLRLGDRNPHLLKSNNLWHCYFLTRASQSRFTENFRGRCRYHCCQVIRVFYYRRAAAGSLRQFYTPAHRNYTAPRKYKWLPSGIEKKRKEFKKVKMQFQLGKKTELRS